jgi:predicted nucleic acid-binding protein
MRRMSAGDKFFVDTNVLLYSVDATLPGKQQAARLWINALWESGSGALSWQVLHEFYVNTVRKVRVPKKIARQLVEDFAQWRPPEVTVGLIRRAWDWSDQAQLSYWDSLILAAAERLECGWLLSEDFQSGRRFGTVTIISPFSHAPEEFGLPEPKPSKTS